MRPLIYKFSTVLQHIPQFRKTIFQALGEILHTDFRILEARYTEKYKKK